MPEPGDLQAPGWLQRNWTPKEPFDPTPWLQERYKRSIEAQTLPLQLQGMALKNQAAQLDIEHQGMLNDITNQQQQLYKQEFPVVRDWMTSIAGKSVQEQLNDPGPAVTHPGLQKAVLDYKKQLADTEISKTFQAQQLETAKTANYLLQKGQPVMDALRPDGTWDMQKISVMAKAEDESQKADAIKLALARQAHFGEDKNLIEASRVAELKSQIDASKAITDKVAESTPELETELTRQRQLQYELDALQKNAGVTPTVQLIEGEKFLVNPKNGSVHKISNNISKQQFMAQHVGQWARDDPTSTKEEIAKEMGDFYDRYVAGGQSVTNAPPSLPSGTNSMKVGRFIVTPQ